MLTNGNFTAKIKDDIIQVYMGNPDDQDDQTSNEARLILEIHKVYLREIMTILHRYLNA